MLLYAPSPLGFILFTACFFGWAVFELVVNLRLWRPGTVNRDRLTRYIIIAGMLAAFALAGAATGLHDFDMKWARAEVFYLGLALMAAGLVFRAYCIRQLGRFFIPEVAVQPGQRLIQTGLYRYLRHPSYTGTLITVLGFGLALTNWLSLVVMLVIFGVIYGLRMQVEEAALVEAFGEEYRGYMRRTRRVVPWVW